MLNKFYENEKRSLEKLGTHKQSKKDIFDIESQRLNQIKSLYQNIDQPSTQSSLYYQSQVQQRDNLRSIIEHQSKEMDLAKLEVDNAHMDMMKQFGKIKGLEGILNKRKAAEMSKSEKREQASQDELSARAFTPGNLALNFR